MTTHNDSELGFFLVREDTVKFGIQKKSSRGRAQSKSHRVFVPHISTESDEGHRGFVFLRWAQKDTSATWDSPAFCEVVALQLIMWNHHNLFIFTVSITSNQPTYESIQTK